MSRCLELAKKGLGFTYPNPLVGSVVVHNDTIIGEGWHQSAGKNHAEINAIQSVKNKALLPHATLYVNLEPCSHFGKTPPCADHIIAHRIPNVVIGMTDPSEKVSGSGIAKLKTAGCSVTTDILKEEALELNKRFVTYHKKKRPYIILKWAESSDGYMAPLPNLRTPKQVHWISERSSRQIVHKWRAEEDAIMIGVQTANDDNPLLTTRKWYGKNPKRFVIDPNGRIDSSAAMIQDELATTIIGKKNTPSSPKNVSWIPLKEKSAKEIINILYEQEIQSVLIEGGRITLQSFLDADLWDEAAVFKSSKLLTAGIYAPELKKNPQKTNLLSSDTLLFFKNP